MGKQVSEKSRKVEKEYICSIQDQRLVFGWLVSVYSILIEALITCTLSFHYTHTHISILLPSNTESYTYTYTQTHIQSRESIPAMKVTLTALLTSAILALTTSALPHSGPINTTPELAAKRTESVVDTVVVVENAAASGGGVEKRHDSGRGAGGRIYMDGWYPIGRGGI